VNQRRQIYKGEIVDLGLETIQISVDKPAVTLEIIRHPGGAAVVALNKENEVCLLKQYRHAVDKWLWELPAGKIDNHEPPLQTIKRELREEAGITATQWNQLGQMVSSPGILDEVLYLYLARNLASTQTEHELHEYIEIHWMNFDSALEMAQNNEIIDGKSIIALFRAQHFINSSNNA